MIRKKVDEYLERAEKLKDHLGKAGEKRSRSAVGANGSSTGGVGGTGRGDKGEEDGDDPEVKKLRAGLTSMSIDSQPAFPYLETKRSFRCYRDGDAKCQLGRCRRARSSERITEGGCHPTHQIPSSIHRETDALAWYTSVRTSWDGKEFPCQGRCNRGKEHFLQCELG